MMVSAISIFMKNETWENSVQIFQIVHRSSSQFTRNKSLAHFLFKYDPTTEVKTDNKY